MEELTINKKNTHRKARKLFGTGSNDLDICCLDDDPNGKGMFSTLQEILDLRCNKLLLFKITNDYSYKKIQNKIASDKIAHNSTIVGG